MAPQRVLSAGLGQYISGALEIETQPGIALDSFCGLADPESVQVAMKLQFGYEQIEARSKEKRSRNNPQKLSMNLHRGRG